MDVREIDPKVMVPWKRPVCGGEWAGDEMRCAHERNTPHSGNGVCGEMPGELLGARGTDNEGAAGAVRHQVVGAHIIELEGALPRARAVDACQEARLVHVHGRTGSNADGAECDGVD
eukprot:7387755-Prymnesium_polylepis.2